MSLDDFSVTYFTKAPGLNTMSTMINAEYRKGIQTEIYALSTIVSDFERFLIFIIPMHTRVPSTVAISDAPPASRSVL